MIYGYSYNLVLGHRYYRTEWSKEINELKFGKCTEPHGHNYTISIAIECKLDLNIQEQLTALDRQIYNEILNWDHQFIDSHHKDFLGMIPTTEILTKVLAQKIQPLLPNDLKLKRVLVYEGAKISAEGSY